MMRRLLAIALLLLLFCFSAIQNLNAAIFEVTNTNDNGTNSFRWALEQANSNAGADIINITTIGSVLLSSNLPQITDDLTINGDGLVIDGDNSYQIFNITGCTVAINDLTIQKGSISSIPLGSSLFHTDAFVSINNCKFDNNTSNGHAGAILNAGTINIISNCTFTNNSTGTNRRGGAIFNESTGIITKISNTTFSNNAATDNGGAILNYGTINTINNCTFTGNTAFSGAGIHNFSSNISEPAYIQSIRNCTFNNNVASYGGGGIANYNNASIGNISYSTFFRNEASYHGGAIYIISETSVNSITRSNFQRNNAGQYGGAIYCAGNLMDLTYCNINNNNAVYDGGGLCNYGNINSFTHSTINGNTSNNGGAIYNSGTISTISFSTISNNMTEIQGYSTPLGGGIYNVNGIISNMYNVTISGNYADIGGAIYQTGSSSNIDNLNKATISANTASIQCGGINLLGGSISVKNTIIAGNTSPDNYDYLYIDLFSAVLNDNGYNIVGISNVAANATGGFNHSRSILFNTRYGESGTNFTSWTRGGTYTTRTLDILPLEDNGGLTKTMGLGKNSLANYAGIADIDEDQREYKRKSPPTIGAFEFEAHIPTLSEWSVIIFIGLLAGVGGWFVWRRA